MRVIRWATILFAAGICSPSRCEATSAVDSVRTQFEAANVQYRAKQYDSAIIAYHHVAARALPLAQDSVWTVLRDAHYNAACCYALTGRRFEAIVYLDSAMEHGFWDVDFMSTDRDLQLLHGDTRFDSLRSWIRRLKRSYAERVRAAPTPVRLPHDSSHLRTAPILVALHGASSFPNEALKYWEQAADSLGCVLVAPYGLFVKSPRELSFGLNADSVDKVVQLALARIADWLGGGPRTVIIAGTGAGAAMAYSVGMKHPEMFRGVLAVNGYFDAAYCGKFIPDARRHGICVLGVYDSTGASIPSSNIRAEDELRAAQVNVRMMPTRNPESAKDETMLLNALHWILDE